MLLCGLWVNGYGKASSHTYVKNKYAGQMFRFRSNRNSYTYAKTKIPNEKSYMRIGCMVFRHMIHAYVYDNHIANIQMKEETRTQTHTH